MISTALGRVQLPGKIPVPIYSWVDGKNILIVLIVFGRADGPVVSALNCRIYDRGTISAPDFPLRVALPVYPAVNGYRDLLWKLNAAERSTDNIASLCAEIWKRMKTFSAGHIDT